MPMHSKFKHDATLLDVEESPEQFDVSFETQADTTFTTTEVNSDAFKEKLPARAHTSGGKNSHDSYYNPQPE